jgi:hypothetical protein
MTKKALLIGINYIGTFQALKGCINDINNISAVLTSNCAYLPQNVRILTDNTSVKPTRAAIIDGINWLVSDNKFGDTLVFYYSGHGSSITDIDNDEYDKRDEVLVPLDYKTSGIITDDWLYTNLARKVLTGVTLWGFTDCCHSGTMCDLTCNYDSTCTLKAGNVFKKNMPYVSMNWTDTYSFSLEKNTQLMGNIVFFSGCMDTQKSADATINKTAQGAFTYCLLTFLKQNIAGKAFIYNKIKLLDLLKYLKCTLQINGFSQLPRLSTGKIKDSDIYFNL